MQLSALPRAQHVFIISIDGGKPEVMTNSEMPNLKKMVAEGTCTWTADTVYPCLTLPAHTSMLTGVGPAKHRIFWNTWLPAAGVVRVPTVFSVARQAGFSTAMLVGKEKFQHLAKPGSLDWFSYNREEEHVVLKPILGQDEPERSATVLATNVANDAARCILKHKPNLCFIHFTDPDDVGHQYGWGSAQQKRALEDVDVALGTVLKALNDSGIAAESVVIVTADHGGHGTVHGAYIADDMKIPWIAWGKGVVAGSQIKPMVNTCDTAATALWLLDIPVPDSFDGRPVRSAFE